MTHSWEALCVLRQLFCFAFVTWLKALSRLRCRQSVYCSMCCFVKWLTTPCNALKVHNNVLQEHPKRVKHFLHSPRRTCDAVKLHFPTLHHVNK